MALKMSITSTCLCTNSDQMRRQNVEDQLEEGRAYGAWSRLGVNDE